MTSLTTPPHPSLPQAALPASANERQRVLDAYFQRQLVSAIPEGDSYRLELSWPGSAEFYLDPDLARGLGWWSDDLTVRTMSLAVRQEDGFLLALADSWTLFAWSCWLSRTSSAGARAGEPPTILHLDSHGDLRSPRLAPTRDDGVFVDLLTGERCDLLEPAGVARAIASGAVGIGSFMAPFLHHLPSARIVHLCPRRHLRRPAGRYRLRRSLEDDPLWPTRRIALAVDAVPDDAGSAADFVLTDRLEQALADVGGGPILLHLDMDYFNNRFDGRPDWNDVDDRHDPDDAETLAEIDRVFRALEPVAARIEDVTVALSPAFFPADLWQTSIDAVRRGVGRLRRLRAAA